MTELSFLLELLMEHRLEKRTKIMLKNRIAEIQVQAPQIPQIYPQNIGIPVNGVTQSPSMARAIAEMEADRQDLVPHRTVQAVSPQATQALQQRQELINEALNGSKEKRTSPRKF